mgnify:CR=1 FL=1
MAEVTSKWKKGVKEKVRASLLKETRKTKSKGKWKEVTNGRIHWEV